MMDCKIAVLIEIFNNRNKSSTYARYDRITPSKKLLLQNSKTP